MNVFFEVKKFRLFFDNNNLNNNEQFALSKQNLL